MKQPNTELEIRFTKYSGCFVSIVKKGFYLFPFARGKTRKSAIKAGIRRLKRLTRELERELEGKKAGSEH